jgi:hypothetical protein
MGFGPGRLQWNGGSANRYQQCIYGELGKQSGSARDSGSVNEMTSKMIDHTDL